MRHLSAAAVALLAATCLAPSAHANDEQIVADPPKFEYAGNTTVITMFAVCRAHATSGNLTDPTSVSVDVNCELNGSHWYQGTPGAGPVPSVPVYDFSNTSVKGQDGVALWEGSVDRTSQICTVATATYNHNGGPFTTVTDRACVDVGP